MVALTTSCSRSYISEKNKDRKQAMKNINIVWETMESYLNIVFIESQRMKQFVRIESSE